MTVSIQQAACNALGRLLSAKIEPEVVVNYDWPDPETQLPARAVSIFLAGSPQDEILQPEVVSSTPIDAVKRLYRWRVLERTQPIQLDVWATYAVNRDDIIAQLDAILNGGWAGTPNNGLALDLADGWTGKVAFDFDGPSIVNTGGSSQVSEFRASYDGNLRAVLYVDAPSPKIAQIILHQVLNGKQTDIPLT